MLEDMVVSDPVYHLNTVLTEYSYTSFIICIDMKSEQFFLSLIVLVLALSVTKQKTNIAHESTYVTGTRSISLIINVHRLELINRLLLRGLLVPFALPARRVTIQQFEYYCGVSNVTRRSCRSSVSEASFTFGVNKRSSPSSIVVDCMYPIFFMMRGWHDREYKFQRATAKTFRPGIHRHDNALFRMIPRTQALE